MKNTVVAASLACLISSPAFANKLSADLNPDTFHIQGDATHASNGLIYSAELFLTQDNGEIIALTMRTNGQVGQNGSLSGGLGGKLYALNDNSTEAALSIGGRLEYQLPGLQGFSLATELYYAPEIIASGDIESLVDFNLRLSYQLFDNGAIFGGVRHLETKYNFDFDHEFDSGPHVGIQIEF